VKQLKSTSSDLRQLFDQNITVRHVAEFLMSFDGNYRADEARRFMEDKDFDVIGVRHMGAVMGYAKRDKLGSGTLSDHLNQFEPSDLLPDGTPLLTTLKSLRDAPQKFVVILDHVSGIVTRGDMQKAPVRMWLFGLITLIEMQLLRVIRERYPDGSWKNLLKPTRLEAASNLYALRQQRKEAIDLADCLQFCDKREIILATPDLVTSMEIDPKGRRASCLKKLEQVRDRLAHSQDIVSGLWPDLVELANEAEEILRQCEELIGKENTATQ
jgi:hypothetical protein